MLRSFFEDSRGGMSMTRFVMFSLTLFGGMDMLTICVYTLSSTNPQPGVITALSVALGAVVVNGVVAVITRK